MFLRYNFISIIWAVMIAIQSGYPGNKLPVSNFVYLDKIIHIATFIIFGVLLSWGFVKQFKFEFLRKNYVLIAVLTAVFYGAIMEVLQNYIFINRYGDICDFIADSIGSVIGVAICFFYFSRK